MEVAKRTATPKIEQKSSSTQAETLTLAEKSVQVPEIGKSDERKSTQDEELEKPVKSTPVGAQSPSNKSKEAQRSAKKSTDSESSPVKEEAQVAKARKTEVKTTAAESSPTIDGSPAKKSRMLRGKASTEAGNNHMFSLNPIGNIYYRFLVIWEIIITIFIGRGLPVLYDNTDRVIVQGVSQQGVWVSFGLIYQCLIYG